jgi:hypothetical protein
VHQVLIPHSLFLVFLELEALQVESFVKVFGCDLIPVLDGMDIPDIPHFDDLCG